MSEGFTEIMRARSGEELLLGTSSAEEALQKLAVRLVSKALRSREIKLGGKYLLRVRIDSLGEEDSND